MARNEWLNFCETYETEKNLYSKWSDMHAECVEVYGGTAGHYNRILELDLMRRGIEKKMHFPACVDARERYDKSYHAHIKNVVRYIAAREMHWQNEAFNNRGR